MLTVERETKQFAIPASRTGAPPAEYPVARNQRNRFAPPPITTEHYTQTNEPPKRTQATEQTPLLTLNRSQLLVDQWSGDTARLAQLTLQNPGYHKILRDVRTNIKKLNTTNTSFYEGIIRGMTFEHIAFEYRKGQAKPGEHLIPPLKTQELFSNKSMQRYYEQYGVHMVSPDFLVIQEIDDKNEDIADSREEIVDEDQTQTELTGRVLIVGAGEITTSNLFEDWWWHDNPFEKERLSRKRRQLQAVDSGLVIQHLYTDPRHPIDHVESVEDAVLSCFPNIPTSRRQLDFDHEYYHSELLLPEGIKRFPTLLTGKPTIVPIHIRQIRQLSDSLINDILHPSVTLSPDVPYSISNRAAD